MIKKNNDNKNKKIQEYIEKKNDIFYIYKHK